MTVLMSKMIKYCYLFSYPTTVSKMTKKIIGLQKMNYIIIKKLIIFFAKITHIDLYFLVRNKSNIWINERNKIEFTMWSSKTTYKSIKPKPSLNEYSRHFVTVCHNVHIVLFTNYIKINKIFIRLFELKKRDHYTCETIFAICREIKIILIV